ncbi:MAG: hypothetical protein EOP48_11690 [Sphingobacteriales bacterium]|nr:MAG: hypothetical protein EOP48_11690 [Sphingobacteriales bacterium]
MTDAHRTWINQQFNNWQPGENCKVFNTTDFAFHKVEVAFWQEDEKGEQMWITEPFDVQLNNSNANKRFELYGAITFFIDIASPFTEGETISIEVPFDGSKAFETLVAEKLKKQVPHLKDKAAKDIKTWFKNRPSTATYHHRHYIVDNEYIPFDKAASDKTAYINAFLAKEIEYEIIRWKEYDQFGYEILPNKYFYKYQEPESSDSLIEQFWKLEEEAEALLNEIRSL